MPFDGTGFSGRPDQPKRPAPNDNVVSLIIIVLAFSLLVLPISMGAFVDIIHVLRAK